MIHKNKQTEMLGAGNKQNLLAKTNLRTAESDGRAEKISTLGS